MRILYIYREYKDRRKLYGQMMENLGHRVTYLCVPHKTKANQVSINQIKKAKPDLIWLLSSFTIEYSGINRETMKYIKSKKIPIVVYGTMDTSLPYMDLLDKVWKKVDFAFVQFKQMALELKAAGVNAYYMPLAFYPTQYYKRRKAKDINISFAGNSQTTLPLELDKRSLYLQELKDFGLVVYGKTFKSRLKGIRIKPFNSHEEQRNIYARTKINLEIPVINGPHQFYFDKYHIKNRMFEIPATCNFLLNVRHPDFLEIFDEDTIGYYDDNIESLKENINRYLKDEDIRKVMTRKSHKLVHQKHTYQHRFNDMFKIIES